MKDEYVLDVDGGSASEAKWPAGKTAAGTH